MSSQFIQMECSVKSFIVVYLLTIVAQRGLCEHVCSSQQVNIPEISARKPPNAYRTGPVTEFRIMKVYADDFDELRDSYAIKTEYIEPGFQFWERVMKPKVPTTGVLKVARRCSSNSIYYHEENGVKQVYCAHGCKSSISCSDYDIPNKYADHCRRSDGRNPVTDYDGGYGVDNTDLLVFISYRDKGCGGSTLAYATTCQRNAETDRPEVAYINYCPDNVHFNETQKAKINSTTIHELGHALGFSPSSYAYMRDANGLPRTERKENQNTPSLGLLNGSYRPDNNTLDVYDKTWRSSAGKFKKPMYMLKTENIMKAAKKYSKCNKLVGVELENNGGSGSIGSHLEKSIYNGEIMVATSGVGYISEMTLAFMKDTGWYDVDMSVAETLPWGNRKGCTFAMGNCYTYMQHQISRNKSTSPWCGEVQYYCQPDHTMCNLRQLSGDLSTDKRYFQSISNVSYNDINTYGGVDSYVDYCPYYEEC